MLSRQTIREITGTTIYNRGLEIFQEKKVLSFKYKEEDEEILMNAVVQGSGRKKYKVDLTYNTFYEDISECFCDCPAFHSYDGLCKHCAAVLLECESQLDEQQTIFDYIETPGQTGHRPRLSDYINYRSGRFLPKSPSKETTPAIRDLLRRQRIKTTAPFMQGVPYEKVSLEPFFKCSPGSIEVDFKIGIDTKYVLKDVFEFAQNMESNAEYSYGKKLKFLHTVNAFDPLSQKLVNFLLCWVQENGGQYLTYNYYSYATSYTKLRRIPLSGTEFETLLSLLKDSPVIIDFNGSGDKVWRQTDQKPVRQMRITGKKEGIEVELGSSLE